MSRPKQKRKNGFIMAFLGIFILIIAAGLFIYNYYFNFFDESGAYHPSFGIRIPDGYAINGIDVSRYQQRINWDKVASMESKGKKISFCFIKATQGNYLTDEYFERNWRRSKEAGLIRGAYHYFDPRISGAIQAAYFLGKYKKGAGDLPPVLDVEEDKNVSPDIIRKEVKKWLDCVKNQLGIEPIIYTNTQFYRSILGEDFDAYPFWVAHYHNGDEPRIFRDWHFWQHSESGNVNGIKGKVDFNVFSGDSLALEKLRIR
jgi:lysozyme